MGRRSRGRARSRRSDYLYVAFFALVLVASTITGFVWATKSVTVVVDGRETHYKTQAEDVSALLEQADVPLHPEDLVTPSTAAGLRSGMTVVVKHAHPVTLIVGDRRLKLRVVGSTVAEALVAAGLDPSAGLAVSPSLSTPLRPGMTVTVRDVFMRVVQEEEEAPAPVQVVSDPYSPAGTRRVVREGAAGRRMRIYQVCVVDGKEAERKLQAERVLAAPVPRIEMVGTRDASLESTTDEASGAAVVPAGGRRMLMESTAYGPMTTGDPWTATGTRVRRGMCAVDPRVIPLGSRVFVSGYGVAIAEDTGGAIKGDRIDLGFDSEAAAIRWGRRDVTVVVLH